MLQMSLLRLVFVMVLATVPNEIFLVQGGDSAAYRNLPQPTKEVTWIRVATLSHKGIKQIRVETLIQFSLNLT